MLTASSAACFIAVVIVLIVVVLLDVNFVMMMLIVILFLFFMMIMMMLVIVFGLCVVIFDWNFNDQRMHVIFVRDFLDVIHLIWDFNFFYLLDLYLLNDGVLFHMMMVNGVNMLRHMVMMLLTVEFAMGKNNVDKNCV